jgi:hypothetical protein
MEFQKYSGFAIMPTVTCETNCFSISNPITINLMKDVVTKIDVDIQAQEIQSGYIIQLRSPQEGCFRVLNEFLFPDERGCVALSIHVVSSTVKIIHPGDVLCHLQLIPGRFLTGKCMFNKLC